MVDSSTSAVGAPILLASGSRYRAELLRRIVASFEQRVPDIDESPGDGEEPEALSRRLARAKALAITFDGIVIGSDQVAAHGKRCLGKPGNRDQALAQLEAVSGATVTFFTSVCVRQRDREAVHTDRTIVEMRALSADDIQRYVDADEPYDCAGSFRIEAAGPVLMRRVVSDDPTALIGLPLIWLAAELRRRGVSLPA